MRLNDAFKKLLGRLWQILTGQNCLHFKFLMIVVDNFNQKVLEICHSLEILIIHVVLSLFFVISDQINQGLNEN